MNSIEEHPEAPRRPEAEAEARDHRRLAQRLDLLHFQEDAPGMVFWHPRGFVLYRLLEDAARSRLAADGYDEVRTPQLLRRPVWEKSGHWQHFAAGMFRVEDQSVEAAVKPVSCPGHIGIVLERRPSYRELPIRLAELGVVHRDEPAGTLQGLLRLRQFTQDDGHIFCTEAQADEEVARFVESIGPFYEAFGFSDVSITLSTRPAERAGDDASWDRSEAALARVLERLGRPFEVAPGGGAFYGPKLEFTLRDRLGRAWQCGTIQFDLVMPRRFDVRYVAASGAREHPVMLHRALYGSLERFLAIVLEHHGAALPDWLAPEQVRVLPVGDAQHREARALSEQLRGAGIRASFDGRGESLARRIAEAHADAVPSVLVLGARELAAGEVTLKTREGQGAWAREACIAFLGERCRSPFSPR